MDRNTLSRPRQSARATATSRLPHPSWVQAVSGFGHSATRIETAKDFWDRIEPLA